MTGAPGVTGIVLAGGASSRFGADKLAADLDGAPVLHHALRAVAAVVDDVIVVLAPDAPVPPLPEELGTRLTVARDAEPFGGPLAGVAAGIGAIAGRARAPGVVLVVGGDMPGLVPGVLRLLVDRLRTDWHRAAITLDASPVAPLPMAARPEALRDEVERCLGQGRRSLRGLLGAVPSATVPTADWRRLDPDGLTLRDIDTPADLPGR